MLYGLRRAIGYGVLFSAVMIAQTSFGADRLVGMTSLSGSCYKLIVFGSDVSASCNSRILNSNFTDGRSGFYFTTSENETVTFSGMGTGQIKLNEDTAIQPVDSVIVDKSGKRDKLKAVGKCRFENPYKGSAPVSCVADTAKGVFEGQFMTDGSTPKNVVEKVDE